MNSSYYPYTEPVTQDEPEFVCDKYVRTYVDDIVIQIPTFEAHLGQTEQVFKDVIDSGMTLSLKKSSMLTKSIKFLGHTLSDGHITKNFNKQNLFNVFERQYPGQDKIFEFTSKRVVQKLMRFINWFSRFLSDFAKDIEPFLDLIRSPPPLKRTPQLTFYRKNIFYKTSNSIRFNFYIKMPQISDGQGIAFS